MNISSEDALAADHLSGAQKRHKQQSIHSSKASPSVRNALR